MSQSIKEKYEKFYSAFDKLPMEDSKFIADLVSANLFTGDLRNEVKAQPTQAKKAIHFLDNAISPYIVDDDDDVDLEPLYKLLKVMEKYGGVVKKLAEKIKTAIPHSESGGACSSSSENGMYVCTITK